MKVGKKSGWAFYVSNFTLFAECNSKILVDAFVRSIKTSDIKAIQCEDYEKYKSGNCDSNEKVVFGENVSRNAKGSYFLSV